MTHGQLFAGIGGFGLAAQWAGIENVWANEIDSFCCKVLRKNFPELEVIEDDIRKIKAEYVAKDPGRVRCNSGDCKEESKVRGFREPGAGNNGGIYRESYELKPVDIITGGFPCQPFSHAGKRKGKDDNRYLWPEMLRVIREVKPLWVIGENVAGLKSMENGRTLERILTDLEDSGYHTEAFSIPACSVGAWHRRDRIWIVANSCEQGLQKSTWRGIGGIHGQAESFQGGKSGRTITEGWRYWSTEPNVGRVANGIPRRVDRLKGLGNAIVPQVAYEIFKAIKHEILETI